MKSEIAPTKKPRLIDVVREAGVNVDSWSVCKRGKDGAASNPKFCYSWSFIEPGKVVVLTIWHHAIEETNGVLTRTMNMREFAAAQSGPERKRALAMDAAIQTAMRDNLQLRVIVCDGKRPNDDDPSIPPEEVSKRLLDPVPWSIREYDWDTGLCTLTRGTNAQSQQRNRFPDVDEVPLSAIEGEKKWVQHFQRERDRAIVAAKKREVLSNTGKLACEVCGFDFSVFYHALTVQFCEVHHKTPLAQLNERTKTTLKDLAIVCSNCHRVLHLIKPMPSVEQLRGSLIPSRDLSR